MKPISDKMFVREMMKLWQNVSQEKRNQLASIINGYFSPGNVNHPNDRADSMVRRMQEKIDGLLVIPDHDAGDTSDYPGGIQPGYYTAAQVDEMLEKNRDNPLALQFLWDMLEQ